MMSQSFQLFPEHFSRRDRRIFWLATLNTTLKGEITKKTCVDNPRHNVIW